MAITMSNGAVLSRLVVRRDWTTSGRGLWRLAWDTPGSAGFCNDESDVTGQPYFRTMRAAIAAGVRKYGIRAVRADY
jgi:hypothetical protein